MRGMRTKNPSLPPILTVPTTGQGATWDEAKNTGDRHLSDKVKLVSDILLAAAQGFGDQVVDAANLITDVAEGAYNLAKDIATNPFEYFKTH